MESFTALVLTFALQNKSIGAPLDHPKPKSVVGVAPLGPQEADAQELTNQTQDPSSVGALGTVCTMCRQAGSRTPCTPVVPNLETSSHRWPGGRGTTQSWLVWIGPVQCKDLVEKHVTYLIYV